MTKLYTSKEIEDNFITYKNDFVSYKLWKLGDLDLIIRNNIHGTCKGHNGVGLKNLLFYK